MKISILFAAFNFTDDGGQLRRIKSSTQLFHIERQYFTEFNAKSRLSFQIWFLWTIRLSILLVYRNLQRFGNLSNFASAYCTLFRSIFR